MASKPVIHSFNLSAYRLTKSKSQRELLRKWREMRDYMAKANRTPPCVRLARKDYQSLADLILRQSEGAINISQVTYHGLPVLSAQE
jgi:hypothetical protein